MSKLIAQVRVLATNEALAMFTLIDLVGFYM